MSTTTDTVRYELMVIVAPDIGETAISKRLDALRKSIADAGGEVLFEDLWGLRDLAYDIRKHDQGYYAVMDINIDPVQLKEFDRMLRLEPEVLRHLMMKLPAVYQPKTLAEMDAEAAKQAELDAQNDDKKDKKPRMGGYRKFEPHTPKPEVKEEKLEDAKKPAPKAAKKVEEAEEAPKASKEITKKAPKKKDTEADKKALEDIDAKLDSILSNPDINF